MKFNSIYRAALSVLILVVTNFNAKAQKAEDAGFELSGYLESYYSYDFDKPGNHLRPFFIYNFNRANEININLAFVKMNLSKERVRGTFSMMAGTYANANLASEQGVLKNIFEANAGVKLRESSELWLDAGILPSHIGFESAIGRDCWTLTRSICAEGSPYYESGAKLSLATDDSQWYFAGIIMNGWQRVNRVDGNNTVAFGTQVSFKPSKSILINNSTYIGNDFPDSTKRMRYFADTYFIWTLSNSISVTAGFDIGIQQKSKGSSDYLTWYSPVAILRVSPAPDLYAAFRMEYYHDPSQIIFATGSPNGFRTLGYSVNVDYLVADRAMFRIEARGFESKDAIFDENGREKRDNFALTSSVSISF